MEYEKHQRFPSKKYDVQYNQLYREKGSYSAIKKEKKTSPTTFPPSNGEEILENMTFMIKSIIMMAMTKLQLRRSNESERYWKRNKKL